jgi:hypothetical protein
MDNLALRHPHRNMQDYELLQAWRAVATAKLREFQNQSWRLGLLTRQGVVTKAAAVDRLWEIATAHALVRSLGPDRVQSLIHEPFAAVESERAA